MFFVSINRRSKRKRLEIKLTNSITIQTDLVKTDRHLVELLLSIKQINSVFTEKQQEQSILHTQNAKQLTTKHTHTKKTPNTQEMNNKQTHKKKKKHNQTNTDKHT